MYHHAKRPTPLLYSMAGSICAIGVIGITARAVNTFTDFTIPEPFNTISFVLTVVCWFAGPAFVGWLRITSLKQENAELKAENRRLHDQCDRFGEVLNAIQTCDQEVEVVKVKVDKALKYLEEKQIPLGDTQDIPRLHSINGGGSA